MGSRTRNLGCPYCGQPLHWVPLRWFNRGCYQCDRCGDFPDLDNKHRAHRTVAELAPSRGHVPVARGDRPRVLLVDDSKSQRDLYALMLERTATVLTAERGEDALALAAETPLDAIVLDVLMPGMGGWEVCARLKEQPSTRHVPVIILTSLDGVDAAEPGHRAGAAAVLMKPCPLERLARTIEAVIGRGDRPPVRHATASVILPFRDRSTTEHGAPTILVVVPDEGLVRLARHALTDAGYVVMAASTFPDGLRELQARPPDLLIAALRLGEFNGLQFVASSERRLPAIILGDDRYDEAESRALGAEYLPMPLDPPALVALVRTMLPGSAPPPSRRWPRKQLTRTVPAQVGERQAVLLNVSYGGMCLEIDEPPEALPVAVEVVFPDSRQTVHAELVWRNRRDDRTWLCGAEIPTVTDDWRLLVDAIS